MDWQLLYISLVCGLILISLLYSYCSHTTGILSSIRIYMNGIHLPPIVYLQLYIFRFIYNYSIYIRIRSIDVISRGSIHYYRIQKRSYQLPGVYMSWYILASHLYIVGVTRITSPFIYSLSYIYNSNQLWIVVTIHTHTYYICVHIYYPYYIYRQVSPSTPISRIYSVSRNGLLNEYAYPYSRMHRTHAIQLTCVLPRDIFNGLFL